MNKKYTLLAFLIVGIASFASAADRVFFELNYGVWFYPGFGGKIGWEHYWENEKVGFIGDVSYYNNCFSDEKDWRETIKRTHNLGLTAGVVFNNMGFNGVLRTSEYIKLKALWQTYAVLLPIAPVIDLGFKLDVFFAEETAISVGTGLEMTWLVYPYWYASLGMKFTL
jgi:hypothetical protein